jgi:hypothetical protein
MIGKFSLTGNQSKSSPQSAKSTNSSVDSNNSIPKKDHATKSLFGNSKVNLTGASMSNLSLNFSNMAKKVGEGFSQIPGNMTGTNAVGGGGSNSSHPDSTASIHEKRPLEDKVRKEQINAVMSILEDVNLQCSLNQSGLIIAYTGKNMSPIIHPGIKFTWFRMKHSYGMDENDAVVEQIEETNKSWYSPSIDDIGAMICVQCEDNYDQGLSKYLEVRFRLLFLSFSLSFFLSFFLFFLSSFFLSSLVLVWTN